VLHRTNTRSARLRALWPAAVLVLLAITPRGNAAAPVSYRFTVPEPQHHWMQAEVAFSGLDAAPLELRMSRSSPGRYAIHDFAKNVYDLHAVDAGGRELTVSRPDPSGWIVGSHGPAVTVRYKVYGDHVDGTYLAIDTTHVHMNMPAAILWARGFDETPATLAFEPPAGVTGRPWTAATQLHPGSSPLSFTAPNLQYLMDSPVEFGPLSYRQFTVGSRVFRFAVHHGGSDAELDRFVRDVERVVREEGAVFGEYPEYEPGTYTFLADYLPYADRDGMEHRNSTVMTSASSIQNDRGGLLGTVAHEFFHNWNVERIRPRDIEPFDLDRANMSSDLWLAEGFTEYYGSLSLQRAGLSNLVETGHTFGDLVDTVLTQPGRALRSAEEMSRMAPFIDGGRTMDRTNWTNTVISYYPFGGAIALALDLTLRDRSDNRITLDDFMREMWRVHGKPGGTREGYVDKPYTTDDAQARLAAVSGDAGFAKNFFDRYVRGHDVVDYARLLQRAGMALARRDADRAWLGDIRLDARGDGLRVSGVVPANSPAYAAGIDQDDTLTQLAGERVSTPDAVNTVLNRHRPGERISIAYIDRAGATRSATIVLAENPHVDVVPAENAGSSLSAAQKTFRDRWLRSQVN
jgi:predicted metalloprotease with PDZ domain